MGCKLHWLLNVVKSPSVVDKCLRRNQVRGVLRANAGDPEIRNWRDDTFRPRVAMVVVVVGDALLRKSLSMAIQSAAVKNAAV